MQSSGFTNGAFRSGLQGSRSVESWSQPLSMKTAIKRKCFINTIVISLQSQKIICFQAKVNRTGKGEKRKEKFPRPLIPNVEMKCELLQKKWNWIEFQIFVNLDLPSWI